MLTLCIVQTFHEQKLLQLTMLSAPAVAGLSQVALQQVTPVAHTTLQGTLLNASACSSGTALRCQVLAPSMLCAPC